MNTKIEIRAKDGIGEILIAGSHKKGAIDTEMRDEIARALHVMSGDATIRSIVFSNSTPGQFVSGADIEELAELVEQPDGHERIEAIHADFIATFTACAKPIIARIDGPCAGLGVSIAAVCDIRLASTRSTFAVPSMRLGIGYPAEDIMRLAFAANGGFVSKLVILGEKVDAQAAQTAGFLHDVTDAKALSATVFETAHRLGGFSPLSLRAARAVLRSAAIGQVDDDEMDRRIAECNRSEDLRRAIASFRAGEKPSFEGR